MLWTSREGYISVNKVGGKRRKIESGEPPVQKNRQWLLGFGCWDGKTTRNMDLPLVSVVMKEKIGH